GASGGDVAPKYRRSSRQGLQNSGKRAGIANRSFKPFPAIDQRLHDLTDLFGRQSERHLLTPLIQKGTQRKKKFGGPTKATRAPQRKVPMIFYGHESFVQATRVTQGSLPMASPVHGAPETIVVREVPQ